MKKLLSWVGYMLRYKIAQPFYWSLRIEAEHAELKKDGYTMPLVGENINLYPSLKACQQDVPNEIRNGFIPGCKITKIEASHILFGKRDLTRR